MSVNVTELNTDGLSMTSATGSEIPYEISVGDGDGQDLKAAKIRTTTSSSCEADSRLEVSIKLLPSSDVENLDVLQGKFNLLIKTE